jgi:hypothetical protein
MNVRVRSASAFVALGLCLALGAVRVAAQEVFEPAREALRVGATRIQTGVRIDGLLDEADWARAERVLGFRQIDPDQGAPASQDTEVRLLFDERNLYVGARCRDAAGPSGARIQDLRRDFDYFANDLFGLTLDPYGDGRTAIAFQVNPAGAQRDLQVFDDQFYDREWDAAWDVRTRQDADGWTAEIAIPWATLRYPRETRQAWGVNFVRVLRRVNESSGWSPWPRAYSTYRMTYAGRLDGLEPPPPRRNLRAQPYTIARGERPAGERSRASFDVGGDVKWAITPNLALDVTARTDFAQADADRQVVNLKRFSVFFPERRAFFLENARLFQVGSSDSALPFFSRRLGLSKSGEPLPIEAGVRVTGRGSTHSFGGLLLRTGAEGSEPASTFAVARYQHHLGERDRLGAMWVTRHDAAGGLGPARRNDVFTADGYFRFGERVSLYGVLSASNTRGPGGDGLAGEIWLSRRSNWGYAGWFQTFVTREYRADAGFVVRNDIIITSPAVELDLRPAWKPKWLRALTPAATMYLYHGASDRKLQEGYVRIDALSGTFHDGAKVALFVEPNWQVLDEPYELLPGLSSAPGRHTFGRYGVSLASDQSARLSAQLVASTGGYFDGRLKALDVTLRAAPSPRLALSVRYERNALSEIGLRRAAATSHLVQPELRTALNPRLQLVAFYQYNTAARSAAWNARVAWEFKPLSFVYLVYNENGPTEGPRRAARRDRQLVLKLTWMKAL